MLAELVLDLQGVLDIQAPVRIALHDRPEPLGDRGRAFDGIDDGGVIAVLGVPGPRLGVRGPVAEHVALDGHLGLRSSFVPRRGAGHHRHQGQDHRRQDADAPMLGHAVLFPPRGVMLGCGPTAVLIF